jgi:hypothetical protein
MADTEVPQADEDYVFISALNQYSYCPLRCYWMFVEHEYADNEHTIEGTLGHRRVHTEGQTSRGELFQLRSAYLYSKRYGICGRADLIEERDGAVYPVEYKKGRPATGPMMLYNCVPRPCVWRSAERGTGRSSPQGISTMPALGGAAVPLTPNCVP